MIREMIIGEMMIKRRKWRVRKLGWGKYRRWEWRERKLCWRRMMRKMRKAIKVRWIIAAIIATISAIDWSFGR